MIKGIKLNLQHTRGITLKRVTSDGAHLCGLAPGQHSFKETLQLWRAIGDTASDLTCPGIKPKTSRIDSDVLHNCANRRSSTLVSSKSKKPRL